MTQKNGKYDVGAPGVGMYVMISLPFISVKISEVDPFIISFAHHLNFQQDRMRNELTMTRYKLSIECQLANQKLYAGATDVSLSITISQLFI